MKVKPTNNVQLKLSAKVQPVNNFKLNLETNLAGLRANAQNYRVKFENRGHSQN